MGERRWPPREEKRTLRQRNGGARTRGQARLGRDAARPLPNLFSQIVHHRGRVQGRTFTSGRYHSPTGPIWDGAQGCKGHRLALRQGWLGRASSEGGPNCVYHGLTAGRLGRVLLQPWKETQRASTGVTCELSFQKRRSFPSFYFLTRVAEPRAPIVLFQKDSSASPLVSSGKVEALPCLPYY